MAMSIRPSQPRRLHLASSLHNAVQSQSLPSLCRVSVGLPGPHQKAPAPPNALWLVLFLDLPRLVLPISFREPTVGSASMQRTFTQLEHSSNARSRPAVLIREGQLRQPGSSHHIRHLLNGARNTSYRVNPHYRAEDLGILK